MFGWLKFLPLLPTFVQLVRSVLDLVRTIEDLLGGKVPGPGKKQVALDVIRSTVQIAQKLGLKEAQGVDPEQLVNAASPVIDNIVATLNATGIFKKSPAPIAAG